MMWQTEPTPNARAPAGVTKCAVAMYKGERRYVNDANVIRVYKIYTPA